MNKIAGAARLLPAEINTDVHCSSKYTPGKDTAWVAEHAFEQVAPDFKSRFKPGDIIVAGKNFGINSSREQAVHALKMMGVAAVVAPAFGRQFFRNAVNNGLAVVECDISRVTEGARLELDLTEGRLRVAESGAECRVSPLPPAIQTLLAAGGLIPFLKQHPDWKIA